MRFFLFLFFFFLPSIAFAQLSNGFNKQEARDMVMVCNSFTFLDLYASDAEIIPAGYIKSYTSPVFGLDNCYQVYEQGNMAVICFRGSTDKELSWLENISSAMIPAKGIIEVNGEKWRYAFARDTTATVHSGYALGIAFMRKDILAQIAKLNTKNIFDFVITGHSQGGALANMLRAYLENLTTQQLSKKNRFKTYAFAAPMTGSKKFATEYNARYAANGSSFNMVIANDPVPLFPVSYNDSNFVKSQVNTLLNDRDNFSFMSALKEGSLLLFDGTLGKVVNRMGRATNKRMIKNLGPVYFPKYVSGINYQKIEKRMELAAVDYPKILKDPSLLNNDSLVKTLEKDGDGNFTNDRLYKKEPWSFQHKPYNYYVAILKLYFPEEYSALKKKFLPENL